MGPAKNRAWDSSQQEWVWVSSAGGSAGDGGQRGQGDWPGSNPGADSAAARDGWGLGSTPGSSSSEWWQSPPYAPAPPPEVPPSGFERGFVKGMAKGYSKGYSEGRTLGGK